MPYEPPTEVPIPVHEAGVSKEDLAFEGIRAAAKAAVEQGAVRS